MANTQVCPHCGGVYARLNAHIKRQHTGVALAGVAGEQVNSSSAPAPLTKFFSPRSAELRVVVKPRHRGFMVTPQGQVDIVHEGKSAQFVNGEFETTDPDIINHLTKVYRDPRYPVVNMSAVEREVK